MSEKNLEGLLNVSLENINGLVDSTSINGSHYNHTGRNHNYSGFKSKLWICFGRFGFSFRKP